MCTFTRIIQSLCTPFDIWSVRNCYWSLQPFHNCPSAKFGFWSNKELLVSAVRLCMIWPQSIPHKWFLIWLQNSNTHIPARLVISPCLLVCADRKTEINYTSVVKKQELCRCCWFLFINGKSNSGPGFSSLEQFLLIKSCTQLIVENMHTQIHE